ncbi:MAG: hypothetical protein Q9227_006535 [Pyrenula ochraceoflavens]
MSSRSRRAPNPRRNPTANSSSPNNRQSASTAPAASSSTTLPTVPTSDLHQISLLHRFISEFSLPSFSECVAQESAYGPQHLPQHWAWPLFYYRKGCDRMQAAMKLMEFMVRRREVFEESVPGRRAGVLLEGSGTSQGGRWDRPGEEFLEGELWRFGARGGAGGGGNGQGMTNGTRMNHIYQSLILASRLVKLSGTFLGAFMKPGEVGDRWRKRDKRKVQGAKVFAGWDYVGRPKGGGERGLGKGEERVGYGMGAEEDGRVKEAVRKLAPYIIWEEDENILRQYGWTGIVHHGLGRKTNRPFAPQTAQDLDAADARDYAKGRPFRRKTLVVASELIDNVINSPLGSDKKIFAIWTLALELIRLLGKYILVHNFDYDQHSLDPVWEDYVDRDIGSCWIAFLFGGWILKPHGHPHKLPDPRALLGGMQWEKMYRAGYQSPEWTVAYSVPVSYLDNLLRQETWGKNRIGRISGEHAKSIRERLLHPDQPFRKGETARKAIKVQKPWHSDPFKLGVVAPGEMMWIDVKAACGNTFDDQDWTESPRGKGEGNMVLQDIGEMEVQNRKRKRSSIEIEGLTRMSADERQKKIAEVNETLQSLAEERKELLARKQDDTTRWELEENEELKESAQAMLDHLLVQPTKKPTKENVKPRPESFNPNDQRTHDPLPLDLLGPQPSESDFAMLEQPVGADLDDWFAKAATEEFSNSMTIDEIYQAMGQSPPGHEQPPPPGQEEPPAARQAFSSARQRQTARRGRAVKAPPEPQRISWYVIRAVLDGEIGEEPTKTAQRVRRLRERKRSELAEMYKVAMTRRKSTLEDLRSSSAVVQKTVPAKSRVASTALRKMSIRYWNKPKENYECDSCLGESTVDEDEEGLEEIEEPKRSTKSGKRFRRTTRVR